MKQEDKGTVAISLVAYSLALSTRRVAMDAWMTGLMDAIRAHTQQAQAIAAALRGL